MMAMANVDWSAFLGPDSPIPHDVVLKTSEFSLQAHKFVLAAVSSEFRRILYPVTGSCQPHTTELQKGTRDHPNNDNNSYLSHRWLRLTNNCENKEDWVSLIFGETGDKLNHEKKAVGISLPSTSSAEAVQAMLNFIYGGQNQFPVQDPQQLPLLFNTMKLAQLFKIQGLQDLLESNIESFPLSTSNVKDVIQVASNFGDLCLSPTSLLMRCLNLSYNQTTLASLVDVGKMSNNAGLVAGALTRLRCRVSDQNLWNLARLGDAEYLGSDDLNVVKAARELQTRCLERLADLMRFPKRFARITAELNIEDNQTYKKLMRLLDELFCENCESVSCKNGEVVEAEVKQGTKVKMGNGDEGEIIGTEEPRKKIKIEGTSNSSGGGSPVSVKVEGRLFLKIKLNDGTLICDSDSEVFYNCS